MKSRSMSCSMMFAVALAALPAAALAQTQYETTESSDPSERVVRYDLAGPRLGATFSPDGTVRSQFGWHFEHQAAPSLHGPWFIVEKVFMVAGMENNQFMPNGTLIFGMRLPNSFEFGVGPSVTIGGYRGMNSGIVIAAGQSFRAGGIRIPVNIAFAGARDGQHRWTILTGWAIRDLIGAPPRDREPYSKAPAGQDI